MFCINPVMYPSARERKQNSNTETSRTKVGRFYVWFNHRHAPVRLYLWAAAANCLSRLPETTGFIPPAGEEALIYNGFTPPMDLCTHQTFLFNR